MVDQIGVQLDALGVQLEGVDPAHPSAREVRKLVGEHLPGMVDSYRKIPAHLRKEERAGRTPDEQLVDSLDSKFSKGTGTPVAIGLTVEEAKQLNDLLLQDPRVVCYEMTEINPTLDTENTMAENAFDILETATAAILHRESKSTAIY